MSESTNVLPYLGAAAGAIGLLSLGFGVWWYSFKADTTGGGDYDYTTAPYLTPLGQ